MKLYSKLSPTQRISLSFIYIILIGSVLLYLPISNNAPINYLDSLFVATSATCVTGLTSVVVVEQFTFFGQIVLLILIQVGGLGFLTLLNILLLALNNKISYRSKVTMREALNQTSLEGISSYLKRVIKFTIFFECLGALLLFIYFYEHAELGISLWYAIFHSISAFCNAGFDLIGGNSLMNYYNNVYINLIISSLIIIGGLGFFVWSDLVMCFNRHKYRKTRRFYFMYRDLSFHTKIVLVVTISLIFGGMAVILLLEYNNPLTIGLMSLKDKLIASYFQSVTLRTAGFATIPIANLHPATKFFMCVYMFIGGSPTGTAGGIKTVTFIVAIMCLTASIKGEKNIRLKRRSINGDVAKKALSITMFSFFIAVIGLFLITIFEPLPFIDLVFEVFSAFGTVGLTCSLTPLLSVFGKIIVITLMYVGRIGPISMLLFFTKKSQIVKDSEIKYAEETVIVG